MRWTAAEKLLEFLIAKVPSGTRGKDIQVETTLGDLMAELNGDAIIKTSGVKDMTKLMERALLWLHEQQVLTLGKGLTVFRSAMTIHLKPERASFSAKDFLPLQEHYREQTLQTHVMAAMPKKGWSGSTKRSALHKTTLFWIRIASCVTGCPDVESRSAAKPQDGPGSRSLMTSAIRPSKKSLLMIEKRQMSLCWLAPDQARQGCWSTVSPISCASGVRTPNASLF